MDDFVEQLSHDKYVIQIPRLKKMVAQTEVEKILDVFNQTKYATNDNHILDYTGDTSVPQVARIIHHLHRAIVSEEMRHKMDEEDAVHNYIDGLENRIEEERKAKEEAKAEAHRERKAKKEAIVKAAQADVKAAQAVEAEGLERQTKEEAIAKVALLEKQLEAFIKKDKKDSA